MYEPWNIQHSLCKILHKQHLKIFRCNKTAWPWKFKVTTSKDFFTDPVHENLIGYLKDSAVPSSSPAATGQQKPKSTKTNQLPQRFNNCSWEWVFTQIELETLKNSNQGCALMAPGRLRRLTFSFRRLKKSSRSPGRALLLLVECSVKQAEKLTY